MSKTKQFIFGYGSLICADSRARTMESGDAVPVVVQGIERSWSVPLPYARHTAVGARLNAESFCNGVIFEIDQSEMAKLDAREIGYQKIQIAQNQITSDQNYLFDGEVWTYVGEHTGQPCENYPIPMSYLDVIMNGCLSFGEHFLAKFFETTGNWHHLLDDRSEPRYPRFIDSANHHEPFNDFLIKYLPDFFDRRL